MFSYTTSIFQLAPRTGLQYGRANFHLFHTSLIPTVCENSSRLICATLASPINVEENRHGLSVASNLRRVIFVIGIPGSGKRTLCQQLGRYLNYEHLSVRDLIRQHSTLNSEFGRTIANALQHPRRLFLHQITIALLRLAMVNSEKSGFLVHDFPVSLDGMSAWEAEMQLQVAIPCVLLLEVNPQVSIQRCLGKIRQDDTRGVLEKRLEYCIRELSPVVEYYERKGLLQRVDGNKSSGIVFDYAKRIIPSKKFLFSSNTTSV